MHHWHVDRVGELPPGYGFQQMVGFFPGQQPLAGKNHPHVAHRVFQVIGSPISRMNRDVLQGFHAVGSVGSPSQNIVGDGVLFPGQSKRDRIEIVLGAVYSMRDSHPVPAAGRLDGLLQRLKQHNVIIHWVDPFLGVPVQFQMP